MQIRRRAIILGLILVPINCLWLSQMEMATQYAAGFGGGPYPTTFSLFANVILLLLALRALNSVLARFRPDWALNPGELIVIYVMLCIASAVDAIDMIDVLVPMMTHIHRYNDPASGHRYFEDIIKYIPSYFTVTDVGALKAWHEGRPEAFWTVATARAWWPPVVAWGGFLLVMLGVMLCLATLLRTKWVDEERLSYPITQIPVQIVQGASGLFTNRLFWIGTGIAAGISLLNGLSAVYPTVPKIPVKMFDLSPSFTSRPWNAMGWTPMSFYPFGIGLGYLLPPDLLFSSWFFYWLLKAERVLASATGWMGFDAEAPYIDQQCFGAYTYVAAFGLWLGRRYFAKALAGLFSPPGPPDEVHFQRRWSVLGALLGMVALSVYFLCAGMSLWLVVLAWVIYWLIALSVTRMRAELGPPAHDLHRGGPDHILPVLLGTRNIGTRDLNLLTWFYWFNRAYRSLPMPHMLEGYCMARRQGFDERKITWAIVLAGVVGVASTLFALIYFGYHNGAEAKMAGHATGFGWEAFNRLGGWLHNRSQRNWPAIGAVVAGLAFAAGLHRMTIRYIWWALHPLGFALSGSYSMATMWCPMLIAWVAKVCLLHYGGQKVYLRAVPFFIGLLIGDYTMGCVWPILGWILGRTMYSFQQ